ncbi:multidrug efflux SMR transporter [uncultured Agrococcus sp.]|uniref:DMT family transporter n=1 Tax=uncultured Agrococcus sp. TaxID=382258 RepID=UPI0025CE4163|nr:multidrug efflux SMR transporter [uncultured Agrococcus sp.]
MSRWLLLTGAILAEVVGTLALRASTDHPLWIFLVVFAYIAAFALLGLTLRTGMNIGVAYGIWGATGVALVAVFAMGIFGEALSVGDVIGITVIVAGVALIESGSHPRRQDRTQVGQA